MLIQWFRALRKKWHLAMFDDGFGFAMTQYHLYNVPVRQLIQIANNSNGDSFDMGMRKAIVIIKRDYNIGE